MWAKNHATGPLIGLYLMTIIINLVKKPHFCSKMWVKGLVWLRASLFICVLLILIVPFKHCLEPKKKILYLLCTDPKTAKI